jgi:CRISPR-associated protein Cas8a1/Csx13
MEKLNQLTINLFDPGMTFIHRVGLAGLYMTVQRLTDNGMFKSLVFDLSSTSVAIKWDNDPFESFDTFFREAFSYTKSSPEGLIDLAAHRGSGLGDIHRMQISEAILGSFLQHNKQNKIPKGTSRRSASLLMDNQIVVVDYRPLVKPYAHAQAASLFVGQKGVLQKSIPIKTWLFPGAAQRHSVLAGTEIEETPGKFLCLLFASAAAVYIKLKHKNADGKFDPGRSVAICFPYVKDLIKYSRVYPNYLRAPIERLAADGLSEAALSTLLVLKADNSMDDLGIDGCTVFTMGKIGWDKQQTNRTSVITLEHVHKNTLDLFELAVSIMPNNIKITQKKSDKKNLDSSDTYIVFTNLVRGLIAENIATQKEWFLDFHQLMRSTKLAKLVSFEKGGLNQMIEKMPWTFEADKFFVQAIHSAIRNRYGALASQATQRGETIRFDREFEKMRSGLMRAKNAQTLRAELADLFARGGLNKTLQAQWGKILHLYLAEDWQRSRDLALLGLASYAGKGADELDTEDQINNGEDEQ